MFYFIYRMIEVSEETISFIEINNHRISFVPICNFHHVKRNGFTNRIWNLPNYCDSMYRLLLQYFPWRICQMIQPNMLFSIRKLKNIFKGSYFTTKKQILIHSLSNAIINFIFFLNLNLFNRLFVSFYFVNLQLFCSTLKCSFFVT